jgi:hypothetical protein
LANQNNFRIDEFNALGEFIRAWGWNVVANGPDNDVTAPANEFEICVPAKGDTCQAGAAGNGAGQFGEFGPQGVALDGAGNVYVTDFSNLRVEKFGPSGEFLLGFGSSGSGNGEFITWRAGSFISIDSSDRVYVGDKGRIQRFDAAGVYQSQCSVPEESIVQGLAVDSSGKLYATYNAKLGVRKLSFIAGGECQEVERFDIPEPDAFTHPRPTAAAVDGEGHVYAFSNASQGNGFVPLDRIFEFDAAGKVVDQFGKEDFGASTGLATNLCAGSEEPGDLYVSNSVLGAGSGPPKPKESEEAFVRAYGTEPVGCFKAVTLPASEIEENEARLNGTVDPSGAAVSECRFEYGTTAGYEEQVPCVPSELGEGDEPVPVHADVSGLTRGTVYHFRLVAKVGSEVETGSDEEFKTLGPPVISADRTISVTANEAKLGARVNPEGFATTYHFEYTTQAAFEASGFEGAPRTPEIPAGSDRSEHAVAADISGLSPDTTYRWRIVAANSSGTTEGAAHGFTTYRPFVAEGGCANQALRSGPSAFLPDCRAYEMVSPVDKSGSDIVNPGEETGNVRASADGAKITYTSKAGFGDEPTASGVNQYLADRGEGGWETHGIDLPVHGEVANSVNQVTRHFMDFTPDLCEAWVVDHQSPPLLEDGQPGYENAYRRENCSAGTGELETLVPLPLVVPPGQPDFLGFAQSTTNQAVEGVSEDGRRAFINAHAALLPEASTAENGSGEPVAQIYERSEEGLELASVLPNGTAASGSSAVGSNWTKDLRNAVSSDGSHLYWTTGSTEGTGTSGQVYLRLHPEQGIVAGECGEAQKPCTVAVSGATGHFWGASPDGSKALYGEGGNLFEFVEGAGSHQVAEEVEGVVAMSDDLSRVYFISRGKLVEEQNERGEEAVEGEPNLYLTEEGTLSFIGTLVNGDVGTPAPGADRHAYDLDQEVSQERAARTTPDGSRLLFNSLASLSGFDNTIEGGVAAVEAFLYDAESGHLACVSCNPSGARPQTAELSSPYARKINADPTNVQAAGWIPAWEQSLYPSNVLAAGGGRLFFNANDALLPRDTNGAQDVYEWEEAGVGSCTKESPSYFAQNSGCLYLISSGENSSDSEFWEASADGSDVFFSTESSLLPQDPGLIDLYDARVGGGFAQAPHAAACEGEACQSPPPPPRDTSPASAGFHGPGNLSEPKKKKHKHKKHRRHPRHRATHKRGAAR